LEKVKVSAKGILNSQYNKAVYSGAVGAAVDFLFCWRSFT
jgi:hypothetical protein